VTLANRFLDSRVHDLSSTCILDRRDYRVVMHLGALIAIKAAR
jgi:hypothetical protein